MKVQAAKCSLSAILEEPNQHLDEHMDPKGTTEAEIAFEEYTASISTEDAFLMERKGSAAQNGRTSLSSDLARRASETVGEKK